MTGVSYLSSEATQQTNTTGQMTSILDVDPDDGTRLEFAPSVAKGSERGLPLIMDLRDANNNPLPDDTEVLIKVERPTDEDDGIQVADKEPNINAWNSLTLTKQRNEENIDAVKVAMRGVIRVRYVDTMHILVDSSAQVDWTNSELYFYRKGVRSVPHEGN